MTHLQPVIARVSKTLFRSPVVVGLRLRSVGRQ